MIISGFLKKLIFYIDILKTIWFISFKLCFCLVDNLFNKKNILCKYYVNDVNLDFFIKPIIQLILYIRITYKDKSLRFLKTLKTFSNSYISFLWTSYITLLYK